MAERYRVVVVKQDPAEREKLAGALSPAAFAVRTAGTLGEALTLAEGEDPIDALVTGLRIGDDSGLELLRRWRRLQPDTVFLVVTGRADVASAVEAMKLRVADLVTEPYEPKDLAEAVERCLELRWEEDLKSPLDALDARLGADRIIGRSKPMREVFAFVRRAARAESTILVLGESGTGKELIAKAVHQHSRRRDGPFVAVNMAAVPPNLVESELFGHVKGAFTGATATRIGRFEAANGGTIFIDEIGDFALESQAKLLRVLEAHTITPVGGNDEREIDVRVVAATARNLEQLVAEEAFREDLYYRLSVVTISLPPLRERFDDIPLLVRSFLDELCRKNNRPPISPDRELARFLETFDWPGNVRQLRNCLESMVVMARGTTLTVDDLPASFAGPDHDLSDAIRIPPGVSLKRLEAKAIEEALRRFDGNRTHAARELGISVRTLQRKLKAVRGGQAVASERPVRSGALSASSGGLPAAGRAAAGGAPGA